ncbi:MAG: hypothetical protein Kow00127_17430 [Bacteroidales bacterium]
MDGLLAPWKELFRYGFLKAAGESDGWKADVRIWLSGDITCRLIPAGEMSELPPPQNELINNLTDQLRRKYLMVILPLNRIPALFTYAFILFSVYQSGVARLIPPLFSGNMDLLLSLANAHLAWLAATGLLIIRRKIIGYLGSLLMRLLIRLS